MTGHQINIGASDGPVFIPAKYLNRHGLISGVTGSGKSVSVMTLTESLSRIGVPSFVTDIKGDLSGLGAPSDLPPGDPRTVNAIAWRPEAVPLTLLDVYDKTGEPFSVSVTDTGCAVMARALGLTDTQAGVLEIAFAVAGDEHLPLVTLADLRTLVNYCLTHKERIAVRFGLVQASSVAAITRAILRLEQAGGDRFFRATDVNIGRLLVQDATGRGRVALLDCVRLIREPGLYSAVLLAVLDLLARELPERGDAEKPIFCMFFDEAHLIFSQATDALLQRLDQTVRLIRSKGVGIYFASQAPTDIPDTISRQLHLRIQHNLRAVTPGDRVMLKAAAQSLPSAPGVDLAKTIGDLTPGLALVSYMDDTGRLTNAEPVAIAMPRCRLSPLSDAERRAIIGPRVQVVEQVAPPAIAEKKEDTGPFARKLLSGSLIYAAAQWGWVVLVNPYIGWMPAAPHFLTLLVPTIIAVKVMTGTLRPRRKFARPRNRW